MNPLLITSVQNPKVKEAMALFERREREKTQKFLIEGYREITRAVGSGHPFIGFFFCRELFLGSNEEALLRELAKKNVPLYEVPKKVFEKLSYRDRPDGLLGVAPQLHYSLNDMEKKLGKNPFLIVVEAIEKPGNLGTMLRSADAVKADGFIVANRTTDIHNPNVVRASVGTLFTVPVIESGSQETLTWLKKQGIQILAATPHAEKEFTNVDLKGPVAIAVGTEQVGLSDLWMNQADIQVKIPMRGVADSLNVATAATLLMYEVLRQRNG